jgi:hypothetical protein
MAKYEIKLEDGSKYMVETEDSKENKKSKSLEETLLPGEKKTEEKQKQRRDSVDILREEVMTPSPNVLEHPLQALTKQFVTGIKASAIPFERLSATVGGAGVGLQKGEGIKGALSRATEGLTGKTQYRSFDPMRNIGASELVTTPTEMFVEIALPLKIMNTANKMMSPIRKATDKVLMKASDKLLKGADEALNFLGKKLDGVYSTINTVKVNAIGALDDIAKLPNSVIKHLENKFGQLSTYLDDCDIAKARKLKAELGKLKHSSFGKTEKGIEETILDEQVNKAYASIKNAMQKSLKDVGKIKEANTLLKADEAFTKGQRASNFVRKTIVDSTLKEPTKTGSMALKLSKEGDMTSRVALNTLKSASFSANKNIVKAVRELERYNRHILYTRIGGSIGRGITYGGAAGLIGGRIARNFGE